MIDFIFMNYDLLKADFFLIQLFWRFNQNADFWILFCRNIFPAQIFIQGLHFSFNIWFAVLGNSFFDCNSLVKGTVHLFGWFHGKLLVFSSYLLALVLLFTDNCAPKMWAVPLNMKNLTISRFFIVLSSDFIYIYISVVYPSCIKPELKTAELWILR